MIITLGASYEDLKKLKYEDLKNRTWKSLMGELNLQGKSIVDIYNNKLDNTFVDIESKTVLNANLVEEKCEKLYIESKSDVDAEVASWRRNIRKDLINYMPIYYRKSKIIDILMGIYGSKLREQFSKNDEMKKQFLIDAATFMLPYHEAEYQKKSSSVDIEQRQKFILANRYAIGKVMNITELKKLINMFYDCEITEDFENMTVNIRINDIYVEQHLLLDLKKIARTFIPAHIDIKIIYDFIKWDELEALNMNFEQMGKYIWQGLELLNKNKKD
ncbi:putative phage tail protein [Peptostreptococcaceae bacterium AGR-M142]